MSTERTTTSLIQIRQLADQQVGYLEAVRVKLPLSPGGNDALELCIATNRLILEGIDDYGTQFTRVLPRRQTRT